MTTDSDAWLGKIDVAKLRDGIVVEVHDLGQAFSRAVLSLRFATSAATKDVRCVPTTYVI
eukprot:1352662-Alexandrium_andersonii.AAC.1